MPLSEKALLERDAKRNIGEELLQSVREMLAGETIPVQVSPIVLARMKSGLPSKDMAANNLTEIGLQNVARRARQSCLRRAFTPEGL